MKEDGLTVSGKMQGKLQKTYIHAAILNLSEKKRCY